MSAAGFTEPRVLAILPDELYQITLPLPFELEQVNVHLVRLRDADSWLLIDSGFDNTRSFDLLERSLAVAGVQWEQIRQLLLTHHHPDHIGLAQRVMNLAQPKLMMHAEDVDHINEMIDLGRPPWFDPMHTVGGTPAGAIHAIDKEFEPMRRRMHRIEPHQRLHGGERIHASFGDLEVLFTPGHAPGHVCLYAAARKLLFSGDTILKDITPNIAWLPDRDTLGLYLSSLERLSHLDADQILPSHGMPFTGHREWVKETTAHHEERCELILRGCKTEFRTAHELIASVWDREFSQFHYHFAIGEVLAHLVYLEGKGRVERRENPSGSAEWRAAA